MIEDEILEFSPKDNGIIIDLDNVLLEDRNNKNKAKFCNIKKIKSKLEENKYGHLIFIASANLRHRINNVKSFESLIKSKEIFLSPALEDNDWFILKYAQRWDYDILSNDKFKEYWSKFGEDWVKSKRKPFMFINGELIIKI